MRHFLEQFGGNSRSLLNHLCRMTLNLFVVVAVWLMETAAFAQVPVTTTPRADEFATTRPTPSKKSAASSTIVEFELLQDADGGGLYAQHWLKVLQPLDVSLRVRRPIGADKPDVKQREAGNLRYVTVIGTLDRAGKISFPNRSFAFGDSERLKEWIDELRTYGALGTPKGQPIWGLTKEQFARLYESLVKPVTVETENQPLGQTIAKFPMPVEFPVRWNTEANQLLKKLGEGAKIRQEFKGFSTATALAMALGEHGFGFRPNRTPTGKTELLVEPHDAKLEQWPIGWPIQQALFKAAPKLNAMVPIELTNIELSDVLSAIAELSETPVMIDYAELNARQIDLDKIKVSFPLKVTTWNLALRQLTGQQKLTRELWQDEAGRVFVWITTTRAGRAKD